MLLFINVFTVPQVQQWRGAAWGAPAPNSDGALSLVLSARALQAAQMGILIAANGKCNHSL